MERSLLCEAGLDPKFGHFIARAGSPWPQAACLRRPAADKLAACGYDGRIRFAPKGALANGGALWPVSDGGSGFTAPPYFVAAATRF